MTTDLPTFVPLIFPIEGAPGRYQFDMATYAEALTAAGFTAFTPSHRHDASVTSLTTAALLEWFRDEWSRSRISPRATLEFPESSDLKVDMSFVGVHSRGYGSADIEVNGTEVTGEVEPTNITGVRYEVAVFYLTIGRPKDRPDLIGPIQELATRLAGMFD
jgi:hypothetical protein